MQTASELGLHMDKQTQEYVLIAHHKDRDGDSYKLKELLRFNDGEKCFRYLSHQYGEHIPIHLYCDLITDHYGIFTGCDLSAREEFEKQQRHWTKRSWDYNLE